MPSLGPAEILVILVVALLVFGPNKMPEIGRQVARGVREFRRIQEHLTQRAPQRRLRSRPHRARGPQLGRRPGPDAPTMGHHRAPPAPTGDPAPTLPP